MLLLLIASSFVAHFELVSSQPLPDCFAYRTDIKIQEPEVGFFPVQFVVDTQKLVGEGKLLDDCSDLRFRHSDGTWLDHWVESGCPSAATRIWANVSFTSGVSETEMVSMFYHCVDYVHLWGNGTVPASYGSVIEWTGAFYVPFTGPSCVGSGWANVSDMSYRFMKPVAGSPGAVPYEGTFEYHPHSATNSPRTGAMYYSGLPHSVVFLHSGGITAGSNYETHTHQANVNRGTNGAPWRPPWMGLRYCSSPILDLSFGFVVSLVGSYSAISSSDSFLRYDALDGRFVLGRTVVGALGGSVNHNHYLSGTCTGATPGMTIQYNSGGLAWAKNVNHPHSLSGTWSSHASSLPSYKPTVFALVTAASEDGLEMSEEMFFMVTEIPPIGFEAYAGHDGVYAMGSDQPGPAIEAATLTAHYASLSGGSSQGLSYGNLADLGTNRYDGNSGHYHSPFHYASSSSSNDDLKRMEMPAVRYVPDRHRQGITMLPEVSLRPVYCETFSATDPLVCNGIGRCVAMQRCECVGGTGEFCGDPFVCFGIDATEPEVCHSRGLCTSNNTCSACTEGYTGEQCEIAPVCSDIPADDSSVCANGQGRCLGPNECVCFDPTAYTGDECEVPICFGLPATDPAVCHHRNGTCTGPNVCECNADRQGSSCEVKLVEVQSKMSSGTVVVASLVPSLIALFLVIVVIVMTLVLVCTCLRCSKNSKKTDDSSQELQDTPRKLSKMPKKKMNPRLQLIREDVLGKPMSRKQSVRMSAAQRVRTFSPLNSVFEQVVFELDDPTNRKILLVGKGEVTTVEILDAMIANVDVTLFDGAGMMQVTLDLADTSRRVFEFRGEDNVAFTKCLSCILEVM